MAKSNKKSFYAVARGRAPGIYTTCPSAFARDQCKSQTDRFPGAVFKGFSTRSEAERYVQANVAPSQQENQQEQGCSSSASSAGARKRDQPSGSLAQDSGHAFVSGGLLQPSTSPEKRPRQSSLSSPSASRSDSVVCLGSRSDSVVCLDSPPSSQEDTAAVHVQNFAGASGSSGAGPPDYGRIVIDDDDEITHEAESDAKSMSIRDLKEELKKRGIDTSGCVEKADLVAKLEDHEKAVKDGKHNDQLSDYRARHREQHNSNGARMMAAQEVVATNESGGGSAGGSSGGYPIASGDGVGARMMGQMGYTGGGLGSNGQGIQEPIQARPREGRAGLGGENVGLEFDCYQKAAFDACMDSKNVFLTGRGGSGKTFLLKILIEALKKKHGGSRSAVCACAPTGVAALLINGQTLHSLAGCGVPTKKDDMKKMWNDATKKKWRQMKVLVIDEMSMIEPCWLDYLDVMVRQIKGVADKAFGGLQLIVSGDFGQLPCIGGSMSMYDGLDEYFDQAMRGAKDAAERQHYIQERDSLIPIGGFSQLKGYSFQTNFWRDAKFAYFELAKSHRQSDKTLIDALGEVRSGNISRKTVDFFRMLERDLPVNTGVVPTELYCRNKQVDGKNDQELERLPGPVEVYEAEDDVEPISGQAFIRRKLEMHSFFTQTPTPRRIELKVGAQVMCTLNLDVARGLVNGSRGVVKSFATGLEVLEDIEKDLKGGMLSEYQMEQAKIQKGLVHEDKMYPVVYFEGANMTRTMRPEEHEHDVYLAGLCKRNQIPLRLAWALTIHKSQGATLDKVTVQLEGAFEVGQAYVALSRAKCVEGLQVKGFAPEQCMSDELALEFHAAVSNGTVRDFMQRVKMWFAPMVEEQHEGVRAWRDMHLRCSSFHAWVKRWMPEEYQRIMDDSNH